MTTALEETAVIITDADTDWLTEYQIDAEGELRCNICQAPAAMRILYFCGCLEGHCTACYRGELDLINHHEGICLVLRTNVPVLCRFCGTRDVFSPPNLVDQIVVKVTPL